MWTKDSKENIHCVLLLGVRESVGVISPHSLHDVITLAGPRRLFSVSLDPVDESGAPVLEGEGVAVVLVHLLKHPHAVAVRVQPGRVEDTQRLQLESQSTLADRKLGGVCPVQAVDTIGPATSILVIQLIPILGKTQISQKLTVFYSVVVQLRVNKLIIVKYILNY